MNKVKVHIILNTNFMYVKAECDWHTSVSENYFMVAAGKRTITLYKYTVH